MQDTVVGENAKLNCVITDKNVNIKMVLSYQAHQHSLFLFQRAQGFNGGENEKYYLYHRANPNPWMASGGLGDVAGSLPIALRKRLIGCRVVMPLYDSIKQEYKDKMKFITLYPFL